MAITEHNWLDAHGVKVFKDIMLNNIGNGIIDKTFTDVLDSKSDNKHRLSANKLIPIISKINDDLINLNNIGRQIDNKYNELNYYPLVVTTDKPENVIETPLEDVVYIQMNDQFSNKHIEQDISVKLIEDINYNLYITTNTDNIRFSRNNDNLLAYSFNDNISFEIINNDLICKINDEFEISFENIPNSELIINTKSDDVIFYVEDDVLFAYIDSNDISFGRENDDLLYHINEFIEVSFNKEPIEELIFHSEYEDISFNIINNELIIIAEDPNVSFEIVDDNLYYKINDKIEIEFTDDIIDEMIIRTSTDDIVFSVDNNLNLTASVNDPNITLKVVNNELIYSINDKFDITFEERECGDIIIQTNFGDSDISFTILNEELIMISLRRDISFELSDYNLSITTDRNNVSFNMNNYNLLYTINDDISASLNENEELLIETTNENYSFIRNGDNLLYTDNSYNLNITNPNELSATLTSDYDLIVEYPDNCAISLNDYELIITIDNWNTHFTIYNDALMMSTYNDIDLEIPTISISFTETDMIIDSSVDTISYDIIDDELIIKVNQGNIIFSRNNNNLEYSIQQDVSIEINDNDELIANVIFDNVIFSIKDDILTIIVDDDNVVFDTANGYLFMTNTYDISHENTIINITNDILYITTDNPDVLFTLIDGNLIYTNQYNIAISFNDYLEYDLILETNNTNISFDMDNYELIANINSNNIILTLDNYELICNMIIDDIVIFINEYINTYLSLYTNNNNISFDMNGYNLIAKSEREYISFILNNYNLIMNFIQDILMNMKSDEYYNLIVDTNNKDIQFLLDNYNLSINSNIENVIFRLNKNNLYVDTIKHIFTNNKNLLYANEDDIGIIIRDNDICNLAINTNNSDIEFNIDNYQLYAYTKNNEISARRSNDNIIISLNDFDTEHFDIRIKENITNNLSIGVVDENSDNISFSINNGRLYATSNSENIRFNLENNNLMLYVIDEYLIWLYQKVKQFNFDKAFRLDNQGNLYLTTIRNNPGLAFTINNENNLLVSSDFNQCSFKILDNNLLYIYDDNSKEVDITYEPKWICIGEPGKNITNYWRKDNIPEMEDVLYPNGIKYRFTKIEKNYFKQKVIYEFAS